MKSEADFAKLEDIDDDVTDRLLNTRSEKPRWEQLPLPWYQRKRTVAVYAVVSIVQLVVVVGLAVLLRQTRAELRSQLLSCRFISFVVFHYELTH